MRYINLHFTLHYITLHVGDAAEKQK